MKYYRQWFALTALLLTLTSTTSLCFAQNQTFVINKPIKIVVGFPPGGSADALARVLAQQLGGVAPSVIVENKPGAGGRIAVESVKNSEADGATLLLTPASMMAVYPHIYKKLPYDPVNDFAPVGTVAAAPFVIAVGPMVPADVKTLADFVKWSKTNPTKASYGTSGAGSIPHFTGVALGKRLDLDWTHIAYKGAAPAMNDLLAGQVAANVSVLSNALPHIQAGTLRALAISAPQRSSALPNVPTFMESGAKEETAVEWFGVFVPAKTQSDVVLKLNQAVNNAVRSKQFSETLAKAAFESVLPDTPSTFAANLKSEIARWGRIVKVSGFTPED